MSSPTEAYTDQKADAGNSKDTIHTAAAADADADIVATVTAGHKRRPSSTDDQQQQQQQQPLTEEGERPQKKFYRQRAHCNPLSHNDAFTYPRRPDLMDWTAAEHYPAFATTTTATTTTATTTTTTTTTTEQQQQQQQGSDDKNNNNTKIVPTILDIGCGFGGLIMALGGERLSSSLLDNNDNDDDDDHNPATRTQQQQPPPFILGMEIRAKVTEYVRLRILAARRSHTNEATAAADKQQQQHANKNNNKLSLYQNCSVLRTNSMKFLPNYFARASIDKLFFCFPDPHFKRKNHPRRIISERLLSEYAYLLKPDTGKLYCITDVLELHQWHVAKCNAHPLFERVPVDQAEQQDPCVQAMKSETEEGKKVEREGRDKYYAVYRRIPDAQAMGMVNSSNFFA